MDEEEIVVGSRETDCLIITLLFLFLIPNSLLSTFVIY